MSAVALLVVKTQHHQDTRSAGDDIRSRLFREFDCRRTLGSGLHPDILDSERERLGDDCFGYFGRRDDRNAVDGAGDAGEVGVGGEAFDLAARRVHRHHFEPTLLIDTHDFVAILLAIGRRADYRKSLARKELIDLVLFDHESPLKIGCDAMPLSVLNRQVNVTVDNVAMIDQGTMQ